ncbi:hypothetical protein BASA81_003413 [Batrachochytrium salamandrivorans]|nr:hypothetical protein BASA81_003413 [Batrachochytrium salamandrivorans]
MSDTRNQVEQLTEELRLVEKAMDPKSAAASLREYMDQHAEKEGLGGFNPTPNPWRESPRAEGNCCVIS